MFRTLATASVLLVTLSLLAAEPKKEEKPAARELFNGKSLDGWKAVDFVNAGKLHVKDGNLVMDKGKSMTGCVYTRKDFPKSDYEVTFEGKKVEGNDFFCTTTFPVGDSFCSLVVGGWGGGVVGISSINGADASENETHQSRDFKADQWYKVTIRVSGPKVEAWIDKDKVIDLEREGRKLTTRLECRDCEPFGFATYATTGAVRKILVRGLTDAEKKAAAEKKKE
jgi:hypothetical protein